MTGWRLVALAAVSPVLCASAANKIQVSGPVEIIAPGYYVLTSHVRGGAVAADILVRTNDVVIDLNGFTLVGRLSQHGIAQAAEFEGLVVRNGFIRNYTNGTGQAISALGRNNRIEDVMFYNCLNGVDLGPGGVVDRCSFYYCGRELQVGTVLRAGEGAELKNCLALGCAGSGTTGILMRAGSRVDGLVMVESSYRGAVMLCALSNSVVRDVVLADNSGNGLSLDGVMAVEATGERCVVHRTQAERGSAFAWFGSLSDSVAHGLVEETHLGSMDFFWNVRNLRHCVAAMLTRQGTPVNTAHGFWIQTPSIALARGCVAFLDYTSQFATGFRGYETVVRCVAKQNRVGFYGVKARESLADNNPGGGFSRCSALDCHASDSTAGHGFDLDGADRLVFGCSASGNSTNYNTATASSAVGYGRILTTPGQNFVTAIPFANFEQ